MPLCAVLGRKPGVYIISDIEMTLRPITFLGDSLDRLRAFPEDVRRHAGHELFKVQQRLDPSRLEADVDNWSRSS